MSGYLLELVQRVRDLASGSPSAAILIPRGGWRQHEATQVGPHISPISLLLGQVGASGFKGGTLYVAGTLGVSDAALLTFFDIRALVLVDGAGGRGVLPFLGEVGEVYEVHD